MTSPHGIGIMSLSPIYHIFYRNGFAFVAKYVILHYVPGAILKQSFETNSGIRFDEVNTYTYLLAVFEYFPQVKLTPVDLIVTKHKRVFPLMKKPRIRYVNRKYVFEGKNKIQVIFIFVTKRNTSSSLTSRCV